MWCGMGSASLCIWYRIWAGWTRSRLPASAVLFIMGVCQQSQSNTNCNHTNGSSNHQQQQCCQQWQLIAKLHQRQQEPPAPTMLRSAAHAGGLGQEAQAAGDLHRPHAPARVRAQQQQQQQQWARQPSRWQGWQGQQGWRPGSSRSRAAAAAAVPGDVSAVHTGLG